MKGLLMKEILSLKGLASAFVVAAVLLIFYGVIGINITSFIIFFVGLLASVNLFDFDDKSKWDQYAITLPVARRDIVKARYVVILSLVLIALFFGSIVPIIFRTETDIKEMLFSNIIVTTVVIVYLSIYVPMLYKYGVTKGRYLSLFAIAIFVGVIFVLGFQTATVEKILLNVAVALGDFLKYIPYLILPVGFLLYWLSGLSACRIYEHKDF